jgi:hypothetical protein
MSTGYNQLDKGQHTSFDGIDRIVKAFDLVTFTSESAIQTAATRTERLITIYGTARPLLLALSRIPLIPASWQALLGIFVSTLDEVSASFKAGKDLATGPVGGTPKADMEPKLPVG